MGDMDAVSAPLFKPAQAKPKPKKVTFMIAYKGSNVVEYWVLWRRWPRWAFYLLVALWPRFGRSYEDHGRFVVKSQ